MCLMLSDRSLSLDCRKVELRMFLKQNKKYRPSDDAKAEKTEDHSELKALGIPLLTREAVQRHIPCWKPDVAIEGET